MFALSADLSRKEAEPIEDRLLQILSMEPTTPALAAFRSSAAYGRDDVPTR